VSDEVADYDLVKTRTAVTEAETQLAFHKLRLRTGELLDRRKLLSAMASMGHRHRDLLLNLSVRHAHELANQAGVSGRAMLAVLDHMVYQELQEMAAAARAARDGSVGNGADDRGQATAGRIPAE
jgi:hypothetical protein